MKEVSERGIIYKILHYSDRSAIVFALIAGYGKTKLFVKWAFSGKGGLLALAPGTITFNLKETSDMHRFISFSPDPTYYHYTQFPDILMRLNIVFEVFDNLFHTGEDSRALWSMSLKYTADNYVKACLYGVYRLMRDGGVLFALVCSCGQMRGALRFYDNGLRCEACSGDYNGSGSYAGGLAVSSRCGELLGSFADNELFKQTELSADDELELLRLFSYHIDNVVGRKNSLKSLKVFLEMATS
ncbi:DNA repair protein RecO [Deferribacterales bacterium RsTz2092]